MIGAVADDLEAAVRSADHLMRGTLLKAGAHIDLVGGFAPSMREADDATVKHASIYVDTREEACAHAGDIVDPIRRGIIAESRASFWDYAVALRLEITLFRSLGTALEDLAAATLVWETLARSQSAAEIDT
jgi:alanine dehydrogenase